MKWISWLAAGLMVAGSAVAQPYYGPAPMGPRPGPQAAAPQTNNPVATLRSGVTKLLAFVGSDPAPSDDELAAFLDAEVAPFFDFDYMAKTAGGRMFERLSDEQQKSLADQIKSSFLAKMAERLGGYSNQQVRFLPPRVGSDGRTAQVSVAVLNPGSYPARLDFRVYRNSDQWRVYDVAANGQSAIVYYRGQLMQQIRQQQMQRMRRMAPPMGPGMPPPMYGRPMP
jgi:phospholipid transport system substrate-binding protein